MLTNTNTDTATWWAELERLSRALGRVGPDEVCCGGLTPRQTSILRTLVASEGARLSDLAQQSGITPSAMTRVLEKLEAHGLVERVRGAQSDGRAAIVRITPQGRKVREDLDRLTLERADKIFRDISEDERENVVRALKVLSSALEKAGCCDPNSPDKLFSIETN